MPLFDMDCCVGMHLACGVGMPPFDMDCCVGTHLTCGVGMPPFDMGCLFDCRGGKGIASGMLSC